MRNLCRLLLAAFPAALSRTSNSPAMANRHKVLCHNAILCVRYLTDFILMAQYRAHTPATIESMKNSLRDFHTFKDVFLCFRACKAVKAVAKKASKDLQEEHSKLLASESSQSKTLSKHQKIMQELQLETQELVHDILTRRANYNFPKMHLILHFAD